MKTKVTLSLKALGLAVFFAFFSLTTKAQLSGSTSVCATSNSTFTVTGAGTTDFNWTVSQGIKGTDYNYDDQIHSNQIVVNWLRAGTFKVKVEQPSTSYKDSLIVTVVARKTSSLASGEMYQDVCTNGTMQTIVINHNYLNSEITTSIPAGLTYQNNGSAITITGTNLTSTKHFTITMQNPAPCGGTDIWDGVITVGQPTISNSLPSYTICSGEQNNPINFFGHATSYTWIAEYDSQEIISNIPNGVVQNGNLGAYTFQNEDINGLSHDVVIRITPHISDNGTTCDGSEYTFTITVRPYPLTFVSVKTLRSCAGNTVMLDSAIISSPGPNFTPNFYDGSDNPVSNIVTLPTSGTFSYRVRFTDNNTGCKTLPTTFQVNVSSTPVAEFSYVVTNDEGTYSVEFQDQSTITGGSITYWLWDFGDGTDFEGQNPPVHNFADNPPHVPVTLTVRSAAGCTAIVEKTIPYHVSYNDCCNRCPVEITISSDIDFDSNGNYGIYKGGVLVTDGEGVVSGDLKSVSFSFPEASFGTIQYTFGTTVNPSLFPFSIFITPSSLTWSTTAISTDWNDEQNWQPSGSVQAHPRWCTDVTIPDDANIYPSLINGNADECRDITFEQGGTVGNIQYLLYRRALVKYEPVIQKWTMLSAPLKYTYSADFQPEATWGPDAFSTGVLSYMAYFDVRYQANTIVNPDGISGTSFGSFSRPFSNLKEKLNVGKGFALIAINTPNNNNNVWQGTFSFPRYDALGNEALYQYHFTDNGEWITEETAADPSKYPFKLDAENGGAGRGTVAPISDQEWIDDHTNPKTRGGNVTDNRYRFTYEGAGIEQGDGTFTVPVDNQGTTNIIGNPLMSHIDFDNFYQDNVGNIDGYYRVWDGTYFYSYVAGGGMENDESAWNGFAGMSTDPVQQGGRFIAPLQAFFVNMLSGMTQVLFNPANVSVAVAGNGNKLKSNESREDILKISLKMGNYENIALLATLPNASDDYSSTEDIYKLFSYQPATPEIYTVVDNQAIEVNAMSTQGEEKTIPLGIKTSLLGDFNISIEGSDSFNAYKSIQLIDVQENETYDLKEKSDFTFSKMSANNVEGRLYIKFSESGTTGFNNTISNHIDVIINDAWINVSSPNSNIQKIELYDVSGYLYYKNDSVNSLYYGFNPNAQSGIYILKVVVDSQIKVVKIKL